MRPLYPLIVCLFAAVCAPASAAPRPASAPLTGMVMPAGKSLATPTGVRLFPNQAGSAMPGWLEAYDTPAMRIMYRGYCTKEQLPGGYQLVVLREQGLVGAYLFLKDRCVGQVIGEPYVVKDPEAFKAILRRAGAHAHRRILTTPDRNYGLEATQYTRRLGPMAENRWLVSLPDHDDGLAIQRQSLGIDAIYPAQLAPRMEDLAREAGEGLAEFWRARQGVESRP